MGLEMCKIIVIVKMTLFSDFGPKTIRTSSEEPEYTTAQ